MLRKRTESEPEIACRFRGDRETGRLEFMAVGLKRTSYPHGDNPTSGHYRPGSKLRELGHRNAIEYAYEWAPERETDRRHRSARIGR